MLQEIAQKIYSTFGPSNEVKIRDDSAIKKHVDAVSLPRLSHYLPYVAEEDGIFLNKNSVGFVFESLPLIGSSDAIEKKLNGLFKTELPPGSNIQFLLIASGKIKEHLKKWQTPREDREGIFSEMARRRVHFFEGLGEDDRPYCARNFRLLISVSLDGGELGPVRLKDMKSLKKKVASHLENVGFVLRTLDASGLMRNLHEILNPSSSKELRVIKYNPFEDISHQLVDFNTTVDVNTDDLIWSDKGFKTRVFGVTRYPDEWMQSEMGRFIGDFFDADNQISAPFMLHYGVHINDEKTLRGRILAKCSNIEKQANSPIAKWIPSIGREKEEWTYVRGQLEKGARIVNAQFYGIVTAKEDSFENDERALKGLFEAQGWEVNHERYTVLPAFLSCLPMSWGEGAVFDQKRLGKCKTTLSHEPINILPIQGEWCTKRQFHF